VLRTGVAPRVRHRRLTVALVGPDGAGKSTVSARLRDVKLQRPVTVIYMGVNLEASTLMLPTTRLLLLAKRLRGRRTDLVASPADERTGVGRARPVKDAARLTLWMLEEWFRQAVAASYSRRGSIVVFDRHFFADYYHADVDARGTLTPLRRLHGWMLDHGYPKPDLMILLDASAERLHARKPDAGVEWLERRRRQYLELADVVPGFAVIDADRPLDLVVADAADLIRTTWEARS
jgi:thymidylate kinase